MLFHFVVRNILRHPFLSIIKVLGLALGLSGILFIALFIKNELSYDAYHPNAQRIYRFTYTNPAFLNNGHFARIPNSAQIPELAEYFPEVENFVRLAPLHGGVIMHDENFFSFNQGFECDSTFFEMFDAELLIGDRRSILNEPASMVVTESFARKVFGTDNPIGAVLTIPPGQFYGESMDFVVKGMMKEFPQNSHFHPDFVTTPVNGNITWWSWTYLLLSEHADPDNIIAGYPGFLAQISNQPTDGIETKAYLQRLTDIHLHSDKLREIEANGNITNLYVLAIAALILLLISITNFASLTLGMAGFNYKFLAINRLLGSAKRINLIYFALESIIIVVAAVTLTLLVVNQINSLIYNQMSINLFEGNIPTIITILLLFALVGVIAGIQPVLQQKLERLRLGGSYNLIKSKGILVSRGIIITQFTMAIVLLSSVFVISRQTSYVLSSSMGASNNNIICMEVHTDIQQRFELFKSELLKYNTIESVSAMMEPPGGEANDMFPFELEGYIKQNPQQDERVGVFPCDYSFASIFDLEFIGGRNFSERNVDVDGSGEYIINEAAMRLLGYMYPNDIVGKGFKLLSPASGIEIPSGQIIGVVKDFHLSNMKKNVGPLVLFKRDGLWLINFVIAYKEGMREAAIADIMNVWDEMNPAYPFNYEHVDTMYRSVYSTELLQARLLSLFTFVSLFICSMGLLGLSLLITQQRVKEIGIRKVNGAKISEVLVMLNKDFVKWVAIAFIIATPIAYYAMSRWQQNFAYRTELSWWVFALAGLVALGVALLTVSFQSWKAARRNPVESLRYE